MHRSLLLVFLLAVGAGCRGEGSKETSRPCVVPEDEIASILESPDMTGNEVTSLPPSEGSKCLYSTGDQKTTVELSLRTPDQFAAERARFEDQGVLLPPLQPVSGFEGTANVDPRYNSLNVTVGDEIVSVLASSPALFADEAKQLDVERRIAQSALEQLASA